MPIDIDHLKQWIGKTESRSDIATTTPPQALSALLDRDDPTPRTGDELPPCWHWLYFLPLHRQSEIGPDGHALRGGFLPPVSLSRRMWAGGQFNFIRPLHVGEKIARTSRIVDVILKEGRTGALVFVRVRHEVAGEGGLALVEHHDIVYRDQPALKETTPNESKLTAPTTSWKPAPQHLWIREVHPDPVMLFRYSALTFNGHRIHYDRPHAVEIEGYAGLVVHGPLIATLLLDLLRREVQAARLTHFAFRAAKPLFDTAAFHVCGKREAHTVSLWARDAAGHVAMDATATLT